jgi:hypothetical protein
VHELQCRLRVPSRVHDRDARGGYLCCGQVLSIGRDDVHQLQRGLRVSCGLDELDACSDHLSPG